jgi:hypothetical protein
MSKIWEFHVIIRSIENYEMLSISLLDLDRTN